MNELLKNISSINEIDLNHLSSYITEQEFRNYFLGTPGEEHYKLLANISLNFNNSILLDLGTYKGCSALALSYNQSNQIKSFDIRGGLRSLSDSPSNIEFIVDNVMYEEYNNLILSSKFILLDTDHDGSFENNFYQYLKNINYKGYLMLDDINLNDPMKQFWNNISEEKYDITNIGHYSGTGLAIFK